MRYVYICGRLQADRRLPSIRITLLGTIYLIILIRRDGRLRSVRLSFMQAPAHELDRRENGARDDDVDLCGRLGLVDVQSTQVDGLECGRGIISVLSRNKCKPNR